MACLEQAKAHQPSSFCVHPATLDCSTHTAAALAGPDGAEDDAEGALLYLLSSLLLRELWLLHAGLDAI